MIPFLEIFVIVLAVLVTGFASGGLATICLLRKKPNGATWAPKK